MTPKNVKKWRKKTKMNDKKDVVNLMSKERKPKNGEVYSTVNSKVGFHQLSEIDFEDKGKLKDVIKVLLDTIETQKNSIKILKKAVLEIGSDVSNIKVTLKNAGLENMVYDISAINNTESEE